MEDFQACKDYAGSHFTFFASMQVTVPAQPERKELPRITASAEELSAKPVHPCALFWLIKPALLLVDLKCERYEPTASSWA